MHIYISYCNRINHIFIIKTCYNESRLCIPHRREEIGGGGGGGGGTVNS